MPIVREGPSPAGNARIISDAAIRALERDEPVPTDRVALNSAYRLLTGWRAHGWMGVRASRPLADACLEVFGPDQTADETFMRVLRHAVGVEGVVATAAERAGAISSMRRLGELLAA